MLKIASVTIAGTGGYGVGDTLMATETVTVVPRASEASSVDDNEDAIDWLWLIVRRQCVAGCAC